jgi:hypothetical protein
VARLTPRHQTKADPRMGTIEQVTSRGKALPRPTYAVPPHPHPPPPSNIPFASILFHSVQDEDYVQFLEQVLLLLLLLLLLL